MRKIKRADAHYAGISCGELSVNCYCHYPRSNNTNSLVKPNYLVAWPGESGVLEATLILNGELSSVKIGLKYDGGFYHFNNAAKLIQGQYESDDVLYFDLSHTHYMFPTKKIRADYMGLTHSDDRLPFVLLIDNGHAKLVKAFSGEKILFMHDLTLSRNEKESAFVAAQSFRNSFYVHGAPEFEEQAEEEAELEVDFYEPKEIVAYLDRFIEGQDEAKREVAVAFSTYFLKSELDDELLPKETVLLIGTTGVGKTYMFSLLAKKAEFPFVSTKASGKSTSGYVGENMASIFQYLAKKVDNHTPYALIFIDEIDKVCTTAKGSFGVGIQNEVLGWIEEAEVGISGGKEADDTTINTKNIMFICAGAFQGITQSESGGRIKPSIYKIREDELKKTSKEPTIGFGANIPTKAEKALMEDVHFSAKHLIEYGMMPELAGRVGVSVALRELTVENLVNILTKKENSVLKQYLYVIEQKGYTVQTDDEVPRIIAENCSTDTGARALKQVCARMFSQILYDVDKFADKSDHVHITAQLTTQLLKNAGYAVKELKEESTPQKRDDSTNKRRVSRSL